MEHNHVEAFCHMKYAGVNRGNRIFLDIWNSRDGVTPFITFSKEYGVELQHVNWKADVYDPTYKPVKGDLIWVSHTLITATESAERSWGINNKQYVEMYDLSLEDRELFLLRYPDADRFNMLGMMKDMLSDKDKFFKSHIFQLMPKDQEPQPRLVLVKEDWK